VNSAGTGRWILWMNGLKFISEKPVLGYGPDNLGKQYAKVKISTDRPHNELIQFAASLGIPAAIFYIIAIGSYFLVFLKLRKRASTLEIAILCAVIAYLASSMFGNTMYYTSPFFFMILGLSSGSQKLLARESL
jgi:O-antigen ligase